MILRPAATLALVSAIAAPALCSDADEWMLDSSGSDYWGAYSEMYMGPQLDLATAQLKRIADVLGLDDTQREEMRALFAGLEDQHLQAWVEFAERSGDAQADMMMSQDWQSQQERVESIQNDYQREQDRLIDVMLDDLRLLVTPEQEERWEILDRERRRMTTLTEWGCYPEERYDVIDAVNTLDLDESERTALLPVLERYASAMDPALQARNTHLRRLGEAINEHSAVQRQSWKVDWEEPDAQERWEAMQEEINGSMRRVVDLALSARPMCERVGEINERYTEEIASLLGSADRRELEDMVAADNEDDKMMWDPSTYSRSRQKFEMVLNMQEMISAYSVFAAGQSENEWGLMRVIQSMEPLTPEQINDIEALREEIEEELDRHSEKRPGPQRTTPTDTSEWFFTLRTPQGSVTLRHTNPPEDAMGGDKMWTGMGEEQEEEMQEWMARKVELEQQAVDRLRELLTVRQRALIAFQ